MHANCDCSIQLLEAVGSTRERLIEMAMSLRENDHVATASSGIDVRQYRTGGTRVEAYVDAELKDGRGISWWLEFRWDVDAWTVEASVNENGLDGQRALEEIGSWSVATLEELLDRLRIAVTKLAAHSERLPVSG